MLRYIIMPHISSCRLFKSLGLVNTCGDESPTVPEQEPSSGEQELGESAAYAASELKEGGFTKKLTSPNGEYSTFFTNNGDRGSGLYIINNNTKAKSVVYSILNGKKLEDINDQVLRVKDGTLYLLSFQEGVVRKILPLGAASDDTCKIKYFVRLTDYGVLIGPPCGTYNTRDFV
jgi:hypothetical protein